MLARDARPLGRGAITALSESEPAGPTREPREEPADQRCDLSGAESRVSRRNRLPGAYERRRRGEPVSSALRRFEAAVRTLRGFACAMCSASSTQPTRRCSDGPLGGQRTTAGTSSSSGSSRPIEPLHARLNHFRLSPATSVTSGASAPVRASRDWTLRRRTSSSSAACSASATERESAHDTSRILRTNSARACSHCGGHASRTLGATSITRATIRGHRESCSSTNARFERIARHAPLKNQPRGRPGTL